MSVSNKLPNKNSDVSLELVYTKTYEEEMQEQNFVALAESYLESLGIKVRTDMYGYYRNTYHILKDFGEYLSKNNKYDLPADFLVAAKVRED